MKLRLIIIIIGVMFLSYTSMAMPQLKIGYDFSDSAQLVYPKDQNFELKIPCSNETYGRMCSASSKCYLTYISPDTTTLIDNQTMTNSGSIHNYTIVNTSKLGSYMATVSCNDGDFWGTETFEVLITNNGEIPDTAKSIIDLAMLFGLLLFLVFSVMGIFYVKDIRGKFALYWVSHLLSIAVSFIAWQSSAVVSYSPFLEGFFRIIFFVVLTGFLPMFFIGIFFIIKYHFISKNAMELMDSGYDEEHAWRLAEKAAKNE